MVKGKRLSPESTITARLIALILDMPKDEQRALFKELEGRISRKGKRQRTRKPFLMVVDYASQDRGYKDFIQDISAGGAFIETRTPFSVGQEISLTFPLPNQQKHIKIAGVVARVDKKGIGVNFKVADQEQEALIEALLEMI
jgi:uncharacterized protein (TIGR02266 family)